MQAVTVQQHAFQPAVSLQGDAAALGGFQGGPWPNACQPWTNTNKDLVEQAGKAGQVAPAAYGNQSVHILNLHRVLQSKLAQVAMRQEDIAAVTQCMDELALAALQLGPHWRVQPFGGVANGFGMQGTDLDATCYCEGMDVTYAPVATQEMRNRLLPLIYANPRFKVVDQIWTARVPILKLRFDDSLDVDLSCHNTEALPNTQLLRAYSELAPAVQELGLLVKLWAKGEGVCGAPQGYLSSYSLTLMAIYFLQVDPNIKMPCLPTRHFTGRGRAPQQVQWTCQLPSAALLFRFFSFFATQFQWGNEVVSVRHGQRATVDDPAYDNLRAGLSQRLHIEDPFLTGRNLHCVLGLQQEYLFYSKIHQAAQAMQNYGLPAGLRCVGLIGDTDATMQQQQQQQQQHQFASPSPQLALPPPPTPPMAGTMPAPVTNGPSNPAQINGTTTPQQRTKVLQRPATREETTSKKKDHDGKLTGKKGDMAAVPKGPANHAETPPNQPTESEVPSTKLSQFAQTFAL